MQIYQLMGKLESQLIIMRTNHVQLDDKNKQKCIVTETLISSILSTIKSHMTQLYNDIYTNC